MNLNLRFSRPGCADGIFEIRAKGFMLASLHWANAGGPLSGWTALAHVPLDFSGNGRFRYSGGRAVPPEATHVAARLIAAGFQRQETLLAPIPDAQRTAAFGSGIHFAVMSDLHTAAKPGRIRRALERAASADCLLLPGDLTNDAAPEQFACLWQLINEVLPDTPVLAVCGNHDYPVNPLPLVPQGVEDYPTLQGMLLERARGMGLECSEDVSGAYSARFRGVEILGLNAASHWRRFRFPGGTQLDWLQERLAAGNGRRILLCHAPLRSHNPIRSAGDAPYLSRDGQLQSIVDGAQNLIFLSGHTHISMNEAAGCAQQDGSNIFINDSSVAPTMLRTPEPLSDREWVDGALLHLSLSAQGAELRAQCVNSGNWVSRGYYRWG